MSRKKWLPLGILIFSMLVGRASDKLGHAAIFDDESAWLPEVEELFVADKYSSPEAAGRALARELAQHAAAGNDRPLLVVIRSPIAPGQPSSRVDSIRWALVEALQASAKTVRIAESSNDAEATVVELHIELPRSTGANKTGELRVSCQLPSGMFAASASFVDKRWVDHETDRRRDYVAVHGLAQQPGTEASEAVFSKAVQQELLPRVLARAERRVRSQSAWAKQLAKDQLIRDMADSPAIVDRFRQTFHKSIDGTNHVVMVREALLLDVSDDRISQLAEPVVRQVRKVRGRRIGAMAVGGGSMLASLILGLLGYSVLNWITRGYYVWRLRAATATFFVVTATCAAKIVSVILHAT